MTLLAHKNQEGRRRERPNLGRAPAQSHLCAPRAMKGVTQTQTPAKKKASNVFISPARARSRWPASPCQRAAKREANSASSVCLVSLLGRYSEAGRRLESLDWKAKRLLKFSFVRCLARPGAAARGGRHIYRRRVSQKWEGGGGAAKQRHIPTTDARKERK